MANQIKRVMNELSIEQKSKRYDEAIKRATIAYKDEDRHQKATLERIFLELKEESEDEQSKKWILEYLHDGLRKSYEQFKDHFKTAIAWLEKQGKQDMIPLDKVIKFLDEQLINDKDEVTGEPFINFQNYGAFKETFISYFKRKMLEKQGEKNPADNIESKFHEGDWVVKGNITAQILNVQEQYYIGIDINGNDFTLSKFLSDDKIHLWTVQDAKDGDVLVASDGSIFLFKCVVDAACKHYIALTTDNAVRFNEGLEHYWEMSTAVHPATKEQCDTLLKAMGDAGYTFDFEKKELKKIEQKPAEWSEQDEEWLTTIIGDYNFNRTSNNDTITQIKINWLKSLKDRIQPKQEWSEEDEHWRQKAIDFMKHPDLIKATPTLGKNTIDWLKSLKSRVQPQPKQEWSEEDEKNFQKAIKVLKVTKFRHTADILQEMKYKLIPREEINNWKPSEEDEDRIKNILSVLDVQVCWDGATGKKDNPYQKEINWLKSLRPQNKWKPSNEQMRVLVWCKPLFYEPKSKGILESLINDLKKLKEE